MALERRYISSIISKPHYPQERASLTKALAIPQPSPNPPRIAGYRGVRMSPLKGIDIFELFAPYGWCVA